MNKNTIYYVVTSNDDHKLMREVNLMIKEGWIPIGGISIAIDQGYYMYAQAMIKNDTN